MKAGILAILVSIATKAHSADIINVVPGKKLGELKIDMSSGELKKMGFAFDRTRSSGLLSVKYMTKDDFLIRLKDNKVVQIWLLENNLKSLRINRKKLPAKLSAHSLKNKFRGCKEYLGSGGSLVYCEGDGVEFSFSYPNSSVGFSVIKPSEVKLIVERDAR